MTALALDDFVINATVLYLASFQIKLAYDHILSLVLPCNNLFSIFLGNCMNSKRKCHTKFGVPLIFLCNVSSNTTCLYNHNAFAS